MAGIGWIPVAVVAAVVVVGWLIVTMVRNHHSAPATTDTPGASAATNAGQPAGSHYEARRRAAPPTTRSVNAAGGPHICTEDYPPISQRNNEEGTTLLAFRIETDGSISNVAVEKSSGFQRLDDASISCVTRWRYKPSTKDGIPTAIPWEVNVVWKLH